MRILLVANTLPPKDLSGVGEQVLQLASGLRARGHEVEILGRGAGGAPGPKLLFPILVGWAFLEKLRSFKPHVVQVHESDGVLAAFLTRTLAAASRPKPLLVALLQVSYREEIRAVRALRFNGEVLGRPGGSERRFRYLKAPLHVAFGVLTAWLSDLVLAPSRVTAGEIERDYGVADVGVVPNVTGGLGRDDSELDAGAQQARGENFLYIGRLRIRKGVEILLKAVATVRERGGTATLAIVGDGEHRLALEGLASRLGLEEAVQFLGRRSPEQVRALLSSCRGLVVPSIYEGMPLVILEAMERGVAVVASAVSGIPEVVLDGETGWLVPSEDPIRLAQALGEVLASPEEARRRGSAGQRRVAELYRPRDAAALWEEQVVKSLPGEPTPPDD